MKYFLHDSGSFEDEKVSMLFMEYGYEGLGLFYTILEKLAKQEKPINTRVLKMQLKVGKKLEKCWAYMEDIDLISSNNGETSNKRILKFSESIDEKRNKTAKRVYQHRENQKDTEDVTRYNSVSNAPNSTVHNNTIIDNKLSIDPQRILEDKKEEKKKFTAPSEENVKSFVQEKFKTSEKAAAAFASKFWSHYENNDWKVGKAKTKMKDWHLAVNSTWVDTIDELKKKYPGSENTQVNGSPRRYLNSPDIYEPA
ncbi:DUF4373 domain-containing protein [Dyadobacter chenwenxiniae]|uniref:DUF4373 domain-containing protein n=1 Tax=Dyadobacter chenwenxiniae TaxID=2906456 RepID=A0A9X1TJB1_9BACT|nr:Lin1244/Lin1753 domain-containing protein [Dyadobacter chenwenxiniae]MCF0059878.1 DUF4373 domain-containing protein [Dyadobacter chenwenxiniae]UON85618.1 DUF4373 domain-containing protein [Dyadobacter chenwenxiniae]